MPSTSSEIVSGNKNLNSDVQVVVSNTEQTMFLGMNLSEVRQLLRAWISSENNPESCDIIMLAEYFRKLAVDTKIDDLFIMLKFLYQ